MYLLSGVLFAKRSSKLSASVRQDGAVSSTTNTVPITGAGPSLIHRRRPGPAGHFYIRLVQRSKLFDASKRVNKSCKLSYLTVRVVDSQVRVTFVLVQNFAVDCLLGTSFFDHHVETALPRLRKVVFYHSSSVAFTGQHSLLPKQ